MGPEHQVPTHPPKHPEGGHGGEGHPTPFLLNKAAHDVLQRRQLFQWYIVLVESFVEERCQSVRPRAGPRRKLVKRFRGPHLLDIVVLQLDVGMAKAPGYGLEGAA